MKYGYASNLSNVKLSDMPSAVAIASDGELAAFLEAYGDDNTTHVALVRGEQASRLGHGTKPARVYPVGDTYTFRCECGLVDGDYLVREYALDAWREHVGLEPLINYPLV